MGALMNAVDLSRSSEPPSDCSYGIIFVGFPRPSNRCTWAGAPGTVNVVPDGDGDLVEAEIFQSEWIVQSSGP